MRTRDTARTGPAKPDRALLFLARLANDIAAVHSLPELLERIMLALDEETGLNSCTVALLDERAPDILTIRAASGLWTKARGATLPRDKGLHGTVMDRKLPLVIPNLSADTGVMSRASKVRSGIYAPLVVNDRAIGVIGAYASRSNAFTESDLSLLTVVGRYLAGAVEVARLNEQVRQLAATDALTGLANRQNFLDRLTSEIARNRRTGRQLSVVLLDIDGFEIINSVHGHAAGDELLVHVADLLVRYVRGSDVVARWGGDEFGLLLPETTAAQAERLVTRVRPLRVTVPHMRGAGAYATLASGSATWPKDGQTAEGLVREAHARLCKTKRLLARERTRRTGRRP